MKLRTVPKEVFEMMSLDKNFSYRWINDDAFSLIGLGTSYLLEFFEYYGEKISKYYDRFVKGTEFEDDRFTFYFTGKKTRRSAQETQFLYS